MKGATYLAALALPLTLDAATCRSVANFDDLKQGTSPPNGYAGLIWHGWTVGPPPDVTFTNNITAKTGTNVLFPKNPQTSSITINNGSTNSFTLTSFSAACTFDFHFGPQITNCTIGVTSVAATYDYDFSTSLYQYKHAFGQTASQKNEYPNMQQFQGDQTGQTAYFGLVGPPVGQGVPGDTTFFLDRVVVTGFPAGSCG